MKPTRRYLYPFMALALWAAPTFAGSLERALAPMEQGLPEASISKLRELLKEEGEVSEVERREASLKLADALLSAGRPAEAQEALASWGEGATLTPEERRRVQLLEGRAAAQLGEWEKALRIFESDLAGLDAAIGRAEALVALKRKEEAIAVLEAVIAEGQGNVLVAQLRLAELYLEKGDLKSCETLLANVKPEGIAAVKWKQYLDARLLLAKGQPNLALGRFEDLQRDPSGSTQALVTGALLGVSDSRARLSGLSAADRVLEQFIHEHPDTPYLSEIFAKLDEIYTTEENPSDSELRKWMEGSHPLRAGYATFYAARLAAHTGKADRALRMLKEFDERYPNHPILAPALLLAGQLLTDEGKYAEAQTVLEEAMRAARNDRERAEIEIASASVSFRQGEYLLAATVFRAAGERAPEVWERAVFNSALSWLYQGNSQRFMEALAELTARAPESPYRHELLLEEGLLYARQGPEKAAEAEAALRKFIAGFPKNRRVGEAQLALAELAFLKGDMAAAEQEIAAFSTLDQRGTPSPAVAAQVDHLAVLVADAAEPRDDAKVVRLGEAFLERHQLRRAEVRMKLGEVCSRMGDFAGAQSHFESLMREEPDSPYAESALFLAAQASMKRMSEGAIERAMELFEEVAKLDGPLKPQARLAQAAAQARLGKRSDAILIYDAILRASPDAQSRFAALAGKAENVAALGENDPALREEALAIYSALAQESDLDPLWRTQALYQKGRLLEALERPDDALAAYYDVLAEGLARPKEYYWFYRAGFDAARLCESRKQWESAIAIYRKLAALEGPRAAEAEARVSQLRLEYFIWE